MDLVTGSAGWMYRIGIEDILGLKRRGDFILIEPRIPSNWKQYEMSYRFGSAQYLISVENAGDQSRGVTRVELDEVVLKDHKIHLEDDGKTHRVRVILDQKTL